MDEAIAERSRRTGITADRVLLELGKIAFFNAQDVVDFESGAPLDGADRDDTAAVASIRVRRIPTPDGEGVEREIRFADKLKALELAGKHTGLFREKLVIEGAVPVVIKDDV